jgi:peroxiredoxin
MRKLLTALAAAAVLTAGLARAEDPPKQAPKVVLRSPDGKKSYDLAQLAADGPVLVRLTCACSGCDQELPYFQKLQAGYNAKGLKTLAVFRESPEATSNYVVKKDIRFLWLEDPKGDLWKTFDTKTMPTNILIAKGGRVVKIVPGCTRDGKNAQVLSAEIARLLQTDEVAVVEAKKPAPKK